MTNSRSDNASILHNLLKEKEIADATDFLKKNLLQNPKHLSEIFISLYKKNSGVSREELSRFLDHALKNIKDPKLTTAILLFMKEGIKNRDDIDVDDLDMDTSFADTFNKMIPSLLSHGASSELDALFDEDFFLNCYKDFLPFKQANLFNQLIDIGLEEKVPTILSKQQQSKLYELLIRIAIEEYNGTLFKKLFAYGINKNRENELRNTMSAMGQEKSDTAQFLLSLDDTQCKTVYKYMQQFSQLGKIKFQGSLLTCAVVAAKKEASYEFNPVVLDRINQFKHYLTALKDATPPHRERFIIADAHWICGDIQITQDGQVSVLLIDSLGQQELNSFETGTAIKILKAVFPSADIYFPHKEKQGPGLGCSVFALDDIRHLYTVENYLDPKYHNGGLHDYLKDSTKAIEEKGHIKKSESAKNHPIHLCDLPLPLMRTMQSRKLLSEVIPGRSEAEQALPVNKKGELMTQSARRFFAEAKNTTGNTVPMNMRLSYKLKEMSKSNFAFLRTVPDEKSIKEATAPFTLKGFQERMANKKSADNAPSVSIHPPKH